MNEQSSKLINVKKSITKVRRILTVIEKIVYIVILICTVGTALVGINEKSVNEGISNAINKGTGIFQVNISGKFLCGIINGDVELQELADKGEYALVIIITMCISIAMLFIARIIIKKLLISVTEIEQSETPFSRNLLASFKQIFILVSLMVALTSSELSILITIVVVFVCIYKIIEYGVTLQEEIDELL